MEQTDQDRPRVEPIPDLVEELATPQTFAQTQMRKALRMQVFAMEYLKDPEHNASKAARAAGYSPDSSHTAGSRLLQTSYVQKFLRKHMLLNEEKFESEIALVKAEMLKLASSNFDDLIEVLPDGTPQLNLLDMTRDQAAAIQSIEIDPQGKVKVKLYDKNTAIRNIGQHLKMFTEVMQHQNPDGSPLLPPTLNVNFVKKEEQA